MKNQVKDIDLKIQQKQERLGTTQKNIQLLTKTIKVEHRAQPIEEQKIENIDEDNSDDEELAQYLEDHPSSDEEPEEVFDPKEEAIIKLKDKIAQYRCRVETGLGTTLSEKAYKLVKHNRD